MPLVRADIPHGHSAETKKQLRQAIKDAINRALDPKITKYIYVAIREVEAQIGDGAPRFVKHQSARAAAHGMIPGPAPSAS